MITNQAILERKKLAINWSTIFSDILLAVSFYIFLASAKFGFSCAFGLYCAIMYFYNKKTKTTLIFLGAAAFSRWDIYTLFSVGLPALIIYLFFIVIGQFDKKISPLKFSFIIVLSRFTILANGGENYIIAGYLIEIFLSAMFLLLCVNAFKAPLFRGLKHKVSIDEIVCFAAIILAFYAGLYSINIYSYKLFLTFAMLTLLISLNIYSLSMSLSYAIIIGIAVSLLSGNASYMGIFAVYVLCANVFKDTSKYLSAVSVIFVDLLFAYFFQLYSEYGYLDLIALSSGCFLFLLISKKNMERLASYFGNKYERQLSRHIVNRTRTELNLKLLRVSDVFYEMERIFSGMIKGYMSPEDAVNMLSSDAMNEICFSCSEQARCFKNNSVSIEKGYKALIGAGIDKGKVNFLDIPAELASVCPKSNGMLNTCGRLANSYRQYAIVVSNLDTSRALIGRQFKGVGDILKQLAKETKNSVGFDVKTEKIIVEELAYNNIVCAEAVVYNENNKEINISLLVKNTSSFDKNISKIVSNLVNIKMVVYGREASRREGYSVIHLKPAAKFDVVFGAAGCAKDGREISGDTHSLTRISDDKFLLALCDGMGSGESAEKTSSTAISMVENFYRAGFDSETILSGVNRLLNVGGEDNFAALDICALNLTKGVCDFIKLGSPEGYIKKRKNTEVISSNALPIGILEDLTPSITTKTLEYGDIIILVSDGVSDAFGESDKLKEFIFSESTINPQQFAETLLQKALSFNNGIAKDDMTVLTMRVFNQL